MFDADESTLSGNNGGTELHGRVASAAEIFAKYGNEIRTIIQYNVEDKSRVDDIFQDFFISLVHNPIPAHIEDVKTYLYRAITHDAIDVRRRASHYREGIQKYAENRRHDRPQDDPQSNFVHLEGAREMFRLIENRLSKREATVLWHRFATGLSTADTAKRTNMEASTVAKCLSLAKKKIRNLIPQDMRGNE